MAEAKERIIIAEDSAPNRNILVHLLTKLDYEVKPFEDGKSALHYIESEPQENLVAILSDIMMPNMGGIQLLKTVRKSKKFADLPFVLITAVSDREYIIEAKSLNVNGYILKPVTFQRVTAKLQELFPNKSLPKAG